MDALQSGVRIALDGMDRAEANRAAQELRQALIERVGDDVVSSMDKQLPDELLPRCRTRDGVDASQVALGAST